ncbi:hypothetical protein F5Y16DRAFT_380073 [Xylariaceae sp. FL0255]|nr:hypothetical protein F5Y16DRAFT_380073 [Xylariaceae sp. FL0255]
MMPSFTDLEADARQGKEIVAIAKAAGVKHVIHSSAVAVNKPEFIARIDPNSLLVKLWRNKQVVEEATCTADFETYTILRPASFNSNWLVPKVAMWGDFPQTGVFTTALRPDTIVANLDEKDFAAFVTEIFNNPSKFNGMDTEFASEPLKFEELLEVLSEAAGRKIKPNYLSEEEIQEGMKQNPFLAGQYLGRDMFKLIDMDKIRNFGIPLHTLKEYLAREKEAVALPTTTSPNRDMALVSLWQCAVIFEALLAHSHVSVSGRELSFHVDFHIDEH